MNCLLIIGIQQQLNDIENRKRKDRRCQVLKVHLCKPFPVFNTPYNFVTTHERFVDFDYILHHKALPYMISLKENVAEFVECDESLNPFDVRQNPVLFSLQTINAVRLIRVPLNDLNQASKKAEMKQSQIVWMIQHLRCGSTAWAQVFSSLPNWRVLSEPQHVLWPLMSEHEGMDIEHFADTSNTFKDVAEASYRIFFHHLASCSNVMIKCTVFDQYLLPMITERFPEHKILYAYRNVLPSATSFSKFFSRAHSWFLR